MDIYGLVQIHLKNSFEHERKKLNFNVHSSICQVFRGMYVHKDIIGGIQERGFKEWKCLMREFLFRQLECPYSTYIVFFQDEYEREDKGAWCCGYYNP